MGHLASISYDEKRPESIGNGFNINNKYSDDRVAVYINDENKQIVLSIRGTRMSDMSDIVSDVKGVVFGMKEDDPNFYYVNRLVRSLKLKFKGYKITSYGHSLGGSISNYVAEKNPDIKAVTFNAGSSPFVKEKPLDNVISYRTNNDIVSAFSNSGSNTNNTIQASTLTPAHSIGYF
jgi:putative lipase involved disintegration of autophagic bodies